MKVLPYKRNGESVKRSGGRKKCHWCKRSDSSNLIKCSNCRREFYCMECIKERCVLRGFQKINEMFISFIYFVAKFGLKHP